MARGAFLAERVEMKTLINDGLKFVCHTEQELWRARTLLTKEPGTIAWLNRVLKPGSVFYDIGANVGCYTLYAARIVGESGHVYAFEPHPANAAALLRNIEANGFAARVSVVMMPLSTCAIWTRFHFSSLEPGTSHHGGSVGVRVRTMATTLDGWRETETVAAVKIDVDGDELAILRGGEQFIKLYQPAMQIESEPVTRQELRALMNELGYEMSGGHFTASGSKQIDRGKAASDVIANLEFEPVAVPA